MPRASVVVPLLDAEPRQPVALVKRLLQVGDFVVWSGECTQGTHVGPVFRNAEQVGRYERATTEWCSAARLADLGFGDLWPNALRRAEPSRIAGAILNVLQLSYGHCLLVNAATQTVALWTATAYCDHDASTFLREQSWDKGLIRGLTIRPSALIPEVNIAHCLSPAGRLAADLESRSGKGLTDVETFGSTVGEAVERFSAWYANFRHLGKPSPPASDYRPDQFHPYGPAWERYISRGMPPLDTVPARVLDEGTKATVPWCLVPFPYLPDTGGERPTFNDTTGLACHPRWGEAVIRGALEVLERHNLYTNLLFERVGIQLDPTRVNGLRPEISRFLSRSGKRNDERIWLIAYPQGALTAPVIHAFRRSADGHYIARGSGSGLSLKDAVEGSVMEFAQVNEQFISGAPERLGKGHADWSTQTVVTRLSAYLDSQPVATEVPDELMRLTPRSPVHDVANKLRRAGSRLLVSALPCPVPGWSAVRVLAPGLATNQSASNSAGGNLLADATFPYAVPT